MVVFMLLVLYNEGEKESAPMTKMSQELISLDFPTYEYFQTKALDEIDQSYDRGKFEKYALEIIYLSQPMSCS